MSITINAAPSPKAHIKTLMKIGYDFCTALADIIDNSVSAESSTITIFSPPGMPTPYLTIIDDGHGMDEHELINNMKIGCKDPAEARNSDDLGRFGSGMKTASFSQARKLIVLSKTSNSNICGASWDIDKIISEDAWCLEKLDKNDIALLENQGVVQLGNQGTQIIWQKLTCYQKDAHASNHDAQIASLLATADKHIGLHFHRFMSGAGKLNFYINNKPIEATDPFMTSSSGYQEGRKEKFRCKGGYIEIKTHVLPSFSRMGKSEMNSQGGAAEIAQKQGLYIYRNKRLINAGGWLNLSKHHQLSALARVQIDIPSALDDEWATDVKKATLQLPPRVKRDLKKYLSDPIDRSRKVHTTKGKKSEANTFWKICNNEDEKIITYEVHPDNHKLAGLANSLPANLRPTLGAYLLSLSRELPLQHIYTTMADRPLDVNQANINEIDMEAIVRAYMEENN
jgi:hypothetical protein